MPPSTLDSRTLERILANRHSCRAFKPDAVPRGAQEILLRLAQRSASWCNAQPWQVHITQEPATQRLREILSAPARPDESGPDFDWPAQYHGVYQARRRACGWALYESVGIARGDRAAAARQAMENTRFFGAPHVAIITSDAALGTYGCVDCGGYVATFLLAAASLGIATVAQAALAARPQRIRDFFGLGTDRKVVCGISFGYADADHPANGFRTVRADVAEAVTWMTT